MVQRKKFFLKESAHQGLSRILIVSFVVLSLSALLQVNYFSSPAYADTSMREDTKVLADGISNLEVLRNRNTGTLEIYLTPEMPENEKIKNKIKERVWKVVIGLPKTSPAGTLGKCGDGFCDQVLGETFNTCPADCVEEFVDCGNGIEDSGENCLTCPMDITTVDCSTDGECPFVEQECGLDPACPPCCGDGVCDEAEGETILSCFIDCGSTNKDNVLGSGGGD